MFGGSVEAGETPKQALIREIKEELAHDVENFEEFYRMTDAQGEERIWFVGKLNKTTSELKLSEGKGFGFFTPKEVQKLDLTANTKFILDRFFRIQTFKNKQKLGELWNLKDH